MGTTKSQLPDRMTGFIIFGTGLLFGFLLASGYSDRAENRCHERAEGVTGAIYDQHVARAIEFAKCMNPRKYDPMYDYNRFKGK